MEKTSKNLIKVCKLSELLEGQSKSVQFTKNDIAVFNVKGKYYAIDNLCIHAGAPLSDGSVDPDSCQVTCGWHAWTYDLATGKCVSHPRQDVFSKCYSVKIQDDDIFIQI